MKTQTTASQQPVTQPDQTDREPVLISSLHNAMIGNGVAISQAEIANFFIALKSKPLAILAGPAQSGKTALVQGLARALSGQNSLCFQMIAGHPWYAREWGDAAHYTSLHTRFSTEKILSIIEEAAQPDNVDQVFIACLTRISPAELLSFFTEVAYQLQHGQIMRLGDTHLSEPIPFPRNLRIIGTMDTDCFNWWDSDLLLSATVIQWPLANLPGGVVSSQPRLLGEREFLQSCILSRDMAYRKMLPVLKQQRQPLYSLLQVGAVLKKYIAVSMDQILDEVMIYLANSWSGLGHGLFHPSSDRNLAIALDLAIAQILLPRAADAIRSIETLRTRLNSVFADQFKRSTAFVSALSVQD